MLVLNPTHVLAQAYNYNTVDGAGVGGIFVGDGTTLSSSNKNFTNFYTRGGAGSGGGGGLGGVFFVDQNATLNLKNVQLSSNVARGGTGGSLLQVALADVAVNLLNLSYDITSVSAPGSTPTVTFDQATSTYKVSQITMTGANPLIAAGANVSFGSSATGAGTIREIVGSPLSPRT